VGSQRNLSNNFSVDGLSANDDAAALSGITYGIDAIEQFQVVTSGAQAELGRALGGYVNVVTRSGTNLLHGTVYDYVRDDRFNADNPLLRALQPDESPDVLTRNANFGAGAYPSNPSPTFGQITAVGESRAFQFGARVRF
jgi:hypothetical protein